MENTPFKDICECSEINSFEISTFTDISTILIIGHSSIFGGGGEDLLNYVVKSLRPFNLKFYESG